MNVTTRTIETMYIRISKKLEVKSQKELLLYSLQNGWAVNADFSFTKNIEEVA